MWGDVDDYRRTHIVMASKQKLRLTLPAIPASAVNGDTIAHSSMHRNTASLQTKTLSTKKSLEEDRSNLDPDDLFVRLTIPEIRNIQGKLRADADAKQEELRLMVGERYRDLLQTSASIISMAESSKRVIDALTEMRQSMSPDENEQKPRRSSIRGRDDAHLKTLQSLSAHLKLLLDAPEHLWRLLEKKKHLQAAWLFLLSRVVHRTLVTGEPESWELEGINVLAQFPLVQRQWDTVSQFRSQIAHRATQYLREHTLTSELVCSTVLTLHLLDSLPLPETLTTLLSQRSRTLNNLLSQTLDLPSRSHSGSPVVTGQRKYREDTNKRQSSLDATTRQTTRNHQDVIKAVRVAVLQLLDVVTGTMGIARDVFLADGQRKSLVERSLEEIQLDNPSGTVLTTPSLISTLPSSTHLLMLPQSILSYKPYIDLTSPSTHVDPALLDKRLSTWFEKAIQGLEGHMEVLFEGLHTIRVIWGLRQKVLQKLQSSSGLEEKERGRIRAVLDDGVQSRVDVITRAALKDVEETVDDALRRAVQEVRNDAEETRLDILPSKFLYSPPPIPFVPQLATGNDPTTSFKSFKNALRRRADGRTPFLENLLYHVDSKAKELEEDLKVMNEDDDISSGLRQRVMTVYYPAVQSASRRIVQIFEQLLSFEITVNGEFSEKSVVAAVFLGRVSYVIASSSFAQRLHCQVETLQDFRDALMSLHERSIHRWRTHVVSNALKKYSSIVATPQDTSPVAKDFPFPSEPSFEIISSLLTLTSSLQLVGLPQAELYSKNVISDLVNDFKVSLAHKVSTEGVIWRRDQAQLLWDLTFVQQLPHVQSGSSQDADGNNDVLSKKVILLQSNLRQSAGDVLAKYKDHIDETLSHYLLRCQTLLAPLINTGPPYTHASHNGHPVEHGVTPGPKVTALLPLGTPEADQEFRPAVEVVKPSVRFGLLSVGSTTTR